MYARQRREDGASCMLVALCNARRYYGLRAPRSGSARFRDLRERAGCVFGACIDIRLLCRELGLRRYRIEPANTHQHLPTILPVLVPGVGFHAALAVGGSSSRLVLVNYWSWKGPLIAEVPWTDIRMHRRGNVNRKAWTIEPSCGAISARRGT